MPDPEQPEHKTPQSGSAEIQQRQIELCKRARIAEDSGRLSSAIEGYRQALLLDQHNPTPYLYLAYCLEQNHQIECAIQVYSLAADLNSHIVNAWRNPSVEDDVRLRSHAADHLIRQHFSALHQHTLDYFQQQHPGAEIERVRGGIWCQTHDQPFQYRTEQQRPHLFYLPDLAPIAAFEASDLPWKEELENAYDAIVCEYRAVAESLADQELPYLDAALGLDHDWNALVGKRNWGSFFLYRNGQLNTQVAALTRGTLRVLNRIDTLKMAGTPREVVFSILQGGQHIPPHYGVANTDATVHLPLIVPENSGLRVTHTTHTWREGRMFAFDDSFEHESWNHSSSPRVNLLFEAWHPDLSFDERKAVALVFEYRDRWNRSRRV